MKKKIKDLTLEECFKICQSNKKIRCNYSKCPFYKYDSCWFVSDIEEDLEREVEVDE